MDISQLAIYLQSYYKEVEAVTSRSRGLIVQFADDTPNDPHQPPDCGVVRETSDAFDALVSDLIQW